MVKRKLSYEAVEGASYKAALDRIMKEYFSDNQVQFVVIRGDITTSDYVSMDTIIMKINEERLLFKHNSFLTKCIY